MIDYKKIRSILIIMVSKRSLIKLNLVILKLIGLSKILRYLMIYLQFYIEVIMYWYIKYYIQGEIGQIFDKLKNMFLVNEFFKIIN